MPCSPSTVGRIPEPLPPRVHAPRWKRALALTVWVVATGFFVAQTVFPERDRWLRKDLEQTWPAGAGSRSVQLVNDGTVPIFFEIRHADWHTPRPELLLPGDEQFVDVPMGAPAEVLARVLDLQTRDVCSVVPLEPGWNNTSIDVRGDGTLDVEHRDGGDIWPRRGIVGITTVYPLPVRVDLPWDLHEHPPARNVERESWIGPGTGDETAVCGFALDRQPVATVKVPRTDAPAQTFMIGVDEASSRILLRYDGTLQRDSTPAWRRLARLASL
ncbi:MAG TPA: hypothetical protein VFY71_10100 [Planctomycetota bacterium]|nr:hypothetical protein [Planctomycetota bacterium]